MKTSWLLARRYMGDTNASCPPHLFFFASEGLQTIQFGRTHRKPPRVSSSYGTSEFSSSGAACVISTRMHPLGIRQFIVSEGMKRGEVWRVICLRSELVEGLWSLFVRQSLPRS